MAITQDGERVLAQATLLGAHYAACLRKVENYPAALPTPSVGRSPRPIRLVLNDIVAAHRANRAVDFSPWQTALAVLHRSKHPRRREPLFKKELADVAERLGPGAPDMLREAPTKDPQSIDFDANLWITSVEEKAEIHDVDLEKAKKVFECTDPRNWSKYGWEFWNMSQQGHLSKDGTWEGRDPDDAKWRSGEDRQIYEAVGWAWNADFETSVENVLDIVDPTPELPLDAFRPGSGPIYSYGYRYRLRECRGAQLLDLFDQGGLDIDQGYSRVVYDETKKLLTVTAKKSLHYSRQPCSPPAYDYFLNLMGPALTSMLMTQLVTTGVRRVLTENAPRPPVKRTFTPKGV